MGKLTNFLILICVIVFLIEIYYNFSIDIFNEYGFSLQNLSLGKFWVFITSIFLHAEPAHLILNMLALFFFGRVVEKHLGKRKFLLVFFVSAFLGDLAILTLITFGLTSSVIPTIGISAAVFGLMGTAMLIKPLEFVFHPYLIPVPLILVALIYTLYNIGEFLLFVTTGATSNISYASHIGGLIFGMYYGLQQEGGKKGIIILLFILFLLVLVPILWNYLALLDIFNYVNVIVGIFK
jgi:membrane associated rhomboid family serine protease